MFQLNRNSFTECNTKNFCVISQRNMKYMKKNNAQFVIVTWLMNNAYSVVLGYCLSRSVVQ